ncbi:hypothetical protein I551_8685 [Mycobacterium ulcerans str. Harvey]|uniref:Uncharacterized protein n=1 Tax=Mycobacterium ulcerans str. Harvey TaxID=1299332 RepID=A0ABN0RAS3_MYCUL|nr:hypothetical protein I551_8685 [Mycobacterium ulcerans str. Harvey]
MRLRKARAKTVFRLRSRPVRHPRLQKMSGRLIKTTPAPSPRRWTPWPPAS